MDNGKLTMENGESIESRIKRP